MAIKQGDWLFTCVMVPVQFKRWTDNKHDGFYSGADEQDGVSSHSARNCGLVPVSEKYALWFLDKKIADHFSELLSKGTSMKDAWTLYEQYIRDRCKEDGIEYEGY
jgi:hypothetical protein